MMKGWWWILPLAWVGAPSRVWPINGIPKLKKMELLVQFKDGTRFVCYLEEVSTVIDIYMRDEYKVPIRSADNIVDIGSNVGVTVTWLSQKFPHSQIWAIEPSYKTSLRLAANIHLNGIAEHVTVLNVAVGADDGLGYLIEGNASITNSISVSNNSGSPVRVISLQSLLDVVGSRIHLMKIDCEGSEYDFFCSASNEMLRQIDYIVAEAHSVGSEAHIKLIERLAQIGFRVDEQRKEGALGTFTAILEKI